MDNNSSAHVGLHAGCHQPCHQHTPGEGPFANCFYPQVRPYLLFQQLPITGTGTEKPVYDQPQTTLPTPLPLIQSPATPLVANLTKVWDCRICSTSFHRWQDRDRHEQTHLPHFIHCPLPRCEWRGNRTHTFKSHWQQQDHRPYYNVYGHSPERSQIETYDPRPVLNQFTRGEITLSEAEDQAMFLVQVKACELKKSSMWTNPRGRSRKAGFNV